MSSVLEMLQARRETKLRVEDPSMVASRQITFLIVLRESKENRHDIRVGTKGSNSLDTHLGYCISRTVTLIAVHTTSAGYHIGLNV